MTLTREPASVPAPMDVNSEMFVDVLTTAIAGSKWAWLGWIDDAELDDERRIEAIRNAGVALADRFRHLLPLFLEQEADDAPADFGSQIIANDRGLRAAGLPPQDQSRG